MTTSITVRITDKQADWVAKVSEQSGVSITAIIQALINLGANAPSDTKLIGMLKLIPKSNSLVEKRKARLASIPPTDSQ